MDGDCVVYLLTCFDVFVFNFQSTEQCRLDMTENDIKTGKELLNEEFIKKNKAWTKELEIMVRSVC
jgi:hypothetical protein